MNLVHQTTSKRPPALDQDVFTYISGLIHRDEARTLDMMVCSPKSMSN